MGLVGCILASLYSDVPVVFLSPLDFLQKPFRWLEAISRYRGTISGAPNFAYNLCISKTTAEQRSGLDLSCWDIAGNAAEPVRADTIERFSDTFEASGFSRQAFKPGYGLAESTFMATKMDRGCAPTIKQFSRAKLAQNQVIKALEKDEGVSLVGCGRMLPQGEILIVDPESLKQCPEDKIGEIWISSPSVAKGYWNRPEETRQTFGGYLADTGSGPYLRTGDLGFLENGELFLAGRIKDLIIIHGRNIYPQDIERTVEECHPALRPGCTAAFSLEVGNEEKLTLVQEVKKQYADAAAGFDEVYTAIRRSVQKAHALDLYDILLIKAGNIPKTSSGKIQRQACKTRYLEGALKKIGRYREGLEKPPALDNDQGGAESSETWDIRSWFRLNMARKAEKQSHVTPETAVETVVRKILSILLKTNPHEMDPDARLDEYGLSSLQMMEMDDFLQDLFGAGLSIEEWKEERTINNLTAMLVSKPQVISVVAPQHQARPVTGDNPLLSDHLIQIPPLISTGELFLLDLFKSFATLFWRLEIKGIEHLALKEPFLLCPNHESHLDSFVVACTLPRPQRRMLCTFAAREVFEHPLHKRLSKFIRSIPTDRYRDQWPVLKTGKKLLAAGRHLLIFPEGRRARDGKMNEFLGGAAYLARKLSVPLIPVYLKGTGAIYPPEESWLPRTVQPFLKKEKIHVVFGTPIRPAGETNEELTGKLAQGVLRLKRNLDLEAKS